MICEQCGCHSTQMVSECYTKKKPKFKFRKLIDSVLFILTLGIYGLFLLISFKRGNKVCTIKYWVCGSCGY
ncbi:MAG: hypothetical protein RSB96_01180, partial [Oscillospiraceae bacterium]